MSNTTETQPIEDFVRSHIGERITRNFLWLIDAVRELLQRLADAERRHAEMEDLLCVADATAKDLETENARLRRSLLTLTEGQVRSRQSGDKPQRMTHEQAVELYGLPVMMHTKEKGIVPVKYMHAFLNDLGDLDLADEQEKVVAAVVLLVTKGYGETRAAMQHETGTISLIKRSSVDVTKSRVPKTKLVIAWKLTRPRKGKFKEKKLVFYAILK